MKVWPVLKSLPQMGTLRSRASSQQRRDVGGQVAARRWRRDAGLQRGVGVDLAGGDVGIVLAQAASRTSSSVWCTAGRLVEDLGGAAPDHDQARGSRWRLRNCSMSSMSACALSIFVPPCLHVRAVEALDVLGVEDRLHRLDGRERFLDLLEQAASRAPGVGRGLVGGVLEDVPAAEHQVVQAGQRHEVLDLWAAAVGALAEADGGHLGEGADRLAEPAFDGLDARDEGGGDSADTGDQHAQLALGGGNL